MPRHPKNPLYKLIKEQGSRILTAWDLDNIVVPTITLRRNKSRGFNMCVMHFKRATIAALESDLFKKLLDCEIVKLDARNSTLSIYEILETKQCNFGKNVGKEQQMLAHLTITYVNTETQRTEHISVYFDQNGKISSILKQPNRIGEIFKHVVLHSEKLANLQRALARMCNYHGFFMHDAKPAKQALLFSPQLFEKLVLVETPNVSVPLVATTTRLPVDNYVHVVSKEKSHREQELEVLDRKPNDTIEQARYKHLAKLIIESSELTPLEYYELIFADLEHKKLRQNLLGDFEMSAADSNLQVIANSNNQDNIIRGLIYRKLKRLGCDQTVLAFVASEFIKMASADAEAKSDANVAVQCALRCVN